MVKAIRVHELGGPEVLKWEDVEISEPKENEIRVKNKAVGLNFIDTYFRTGAYKPPALPYIPGVEGVGEVIGVGPGVSDPKVGDVVAYGGTLMGSYAEEVILPASVAVPVPVSLDLTTVAAVLAKGMTARYLVSQCFKGHENEREKLVMQMEAVREERISLEKQLVLLQTQIQSLKSDVKEQQEKVDKLKQSHDQAQSDLKSVRAKMKACDMEIGGMIKEQEKLKSKLSESCLERKKLENEVKRMETEQKDCSQTVDRLIQKHAWIVSEKQLFGKSGTDYDFSSRDPIKARQELETLQTEQTGLEKRVNKRVIAMFEKAEEEYNDLISRKNIIENDKAKIKSVIEELDEKKKETLKDTWVKVNKDFGSIFSTLLPGTTAKLDPPEGGSFLDGLEVKVAFGGVWKQSLSELSGGQRSLLALSLILALLLFKPAPLYILDEVDAALDLSHTQNIGRMIKSHFPHSQFIVVSLKEGMFNNANVLFRTKFVDGVSTVSRTVTNSRK